MPLKAFMQSSALTNFGNQLANELFMQREKASCSLNIAPKWGDSLFELFSPKGEQNKLNCFVFGLFLNIFLYCCLRLQSYEKSPDYKISKNECMLNF